MPESEASLQSLQKEMASVPSFEPVDALHLTILNGAIMPMMRTAKQESLIAHGPETAEEAYSMDIAEVEMGQRARRVTQYAIRLMLGTSQNDHYYEEHNSFRAIAAGKGSDRARRSTNPHITLGYVDIGHGLKSIIEPLECSVGQSLEFGPMQSMLGKVTARPQPNLLHDEPLPRSTTVSNTPVKTIIEGSIPPNFIASLRS
jgi:2'-5' RNA ligase